MKPLHCSCPDVGTNPNCAEHGMYAYGSPDESAHDTAWFCDTAKGLIGGSGQRRQDYGGVEESFERIAKLWSVVLDHEVTAEQVAICMVQLKLARLFVSPQHTDSWVDIIGYAALGGEISSIPGRYI
jgi:hypothetical protein